MSHFYPKPEDALYYVEFERGGHRGEFTLFKRQWMYTEEELKEVKKRNPPFGDMVGNCNELHPWNLFTATYGPPGSMPDETWIKFMVDALNEKAKMQEGMERLLKKVMTEIKKDPA